MLLTPGGTSTKYSSKIQKKIPAPIPPAPTSKACPQNFTVLIRLELSKYHRKMLTLLSFFVAHLSSYPRDISSRFSSFNNDKNVRKENKRRKE